MSTTGSQVKALLILLAGICLFQVFPARAGELVDRIAAIVNEDIVMNSELEAALVVYSQKISSMGYDAPKEHSLLARARRDVLDQLVNQKITDQQVKRLNLSVSEKEITKATERLFSAHSLTENQFNEWLAKEGLTLEAYRNQIKDQLLRSKLVNIEVKSKIVVTRDEVTAHYQRNIEKYGGAMKMHLNTLLARVPADAPPEKRREVQKQMEAIAKALQAGKPPETPEVERIDLGWFSFNELSPQIQGLVKDLKAGQSSGVLAVEQGFQIILVEQVDAQAGKGLDTVSAEIEEELYNAKVDEKFSSWLNELRQRSHIKILD